MATSKPPRKAAAAKPGAKPAANPVPSRHAGPKAAAAPERSAAPQASAAGSAERRADLTPEELRRFIAEAAYFRAQKRGFAPGYELQDWVEAEAEVRNLIGRGP